MRSTITMLAASAASLVCAYPRETEGLSSKRSIAKRTSGFTWFGVSESGAEFGESNIPGTLGADYTWPETSKIQVLRDADMNIFRVPFLMERLIPGTMTGTLDETYLSDLKSTVKFITDSGAYAILIVSSSGSVISSTDDFKTFWKAVAGEFSSNEKVIFDTNNEYHDMDQTLVVNLNQAAIDGIRAAGAKTQFIFVEGNAWTGAWSWTDNNDNMKSLTDPQDKIVYEMHQYLDSDSSGTSETCVSTTIGKERLELATEWLKNNDKKGFIGEFAGGVNADCQKAVEGMLSYMSDNSDVWMGAECLEPTDGKAYASYLPILEKYFVSGSGGASADTATATSTAAARKTSTTAVAVATTILDAPSRIQTANPRAESIRSSTAPAMSFSPIAQPQNAPSPIPVSASSLSITFASVSSANYSSSATSMPAESGVGAR
ncbi:hypothetical protein N7512_000956 [Penicillium capsulatum]|nr:hypothetical protein N7512_000956 [Penicillium capsulatum]